MSLATRQELPTLASRDASSRPPAVVSALGALFARLKDRRVQARHDRAIAALDACQRDDTGIKATSAMPPRPIMEVERGLMIRLMEMR